MKLFTAEKIKKADQYTIEHEPVSSVDLMERAAGQLAQWIVGKFNKQTPIVFIAGPGNNGGDAWALARILWKKGFLDIDFYLLKLSDKISSDSEKNRKRMARETEISVLEITSRKQFPKLQPGQVVIDGIFGSGLSRPAKGLAAQLIKHINQGAQKAVIAIDIPSGLFAEQNQNIQAELIIHADHTLSFQFPKLSFFFPENDEFVGKWYVLPIGLDPEFINKEKTAFNYIGLSDAASLIHSRGKFSHKGTYGHALLIAGSYGMMGAALLASKAGMRAGAGLLTCHVPRMGVEIIQSTLPEVLLSIDESDILFSEHPPLAKYSAIGVGPGLNQKPNSRKAILNLLRDVKMPLVIDADGLNLLSTEENWQELLPENCILTPHPKEFERLFGPVPDSFSRLRMQQEFSKKTGCIVVLKLAHTSISLPDGSVWFNTTGNPGMATGGSGDVLTGIILGLLAQGYSPGDASILGVYLHGLAGDLAIKGSDHHALIASDLVDNIGGAFHVLQESKTQL